MSQFSYADYTSVVAKAQAGSNGAKVGYFKLANDGDEALVRINCGSVDSLDFASVHTINAGGRWLKVSCLNPLGVYNDSCQLCQAAAHNNAISKASKKVYLQMLVSYKDKTTGTWSEAQPVIWERPAAFSREIANKLRDYGDLRQTLLKITRNGAAGDMKTTYSIDYAVPTVFKPEMVPADFSAFVNFNIAKHSYWEKTAAEISAFLATGAFPEAVKADNENTTAPAVNNAAPVYTAPNAAPTANPNVGFTPNANPVYTAPSAAPANGGVNPATSAAPTRNFSTEKYSF